jgi:hypothetical protein
MNGHDQRTNSAKLHFMMPQTVHMITPTGGVLPPEVMGGAVHPLDRHGQRHVVGQQEDRDRRQRQRERHR